MSEPGASRRRFLRAAIQITLLAQLPACWMLWRAMRLFTAHSPLPWILTFLLWMHLGLWTYLRHNLPERPMFPLTRALLVWPFFVWFGVVGLALIPGSLGALAHLLASGLSVVLPDFSSRALAALEHLLPLPGRWFDRACAAWLGASALLALYAGLIRPRWIVTRTLELQIPGLSPALDGFRIVQLSDLHVGNFAPPARLARWIHLANRLEPDLVAITGDLLASGDGYVPALLKGLQGLQAREGVVACMGNHDYWVDGEGFPRRLAAAGIIVLRNGGRLLQRGNGCLYLAGVDDTWSGRADLTDTLADAPPGVPVVLLAHDPALFRAAAAAGVALTLSGHTHGGQLAVPFMQNWNLSARTYPHHSGLYRLERSLLYVHRGLGTTGPPLRLGAAPEVVLLILRREERLER